MKTIIEDYIENIVTNHMNIIRKNQCADLLAYSAKTEHSLRMSGALFR